MAAKLQLRWPPTSAAAACGAAVVIATLSACGGGGRTDEPHAERAAASGAERAQTAAAPAPCAGATADGWCQVLPVGRAEVIDSVDFVDARHGWMAGREGTMLRTADGGASWLPVAFPAGEAISQVYFIDRQRGWAIASSRLWHSEDGGRTWAMATTPLARVQRIQSAGSDRVLIDDSLTGFSFIGTASAISEDFGRTWRLSALPVVAVEGNGRLWSDSFGSIRLRSDDAGRSFVAEPALQALPDCSHFYFGVDASGWAHCLVTSGFGPTRGYRLLVRPGFDAAWQATPVAPLPLSSWADVELGSRGGLAITDGNRVWRTDDAAQSWQAVNLPPDWFAGLPPPMPWETPRQANRADNAVTRLIDGRTMWIQLLAGRGEGARPLHLSFDAGRTWSANWHPNPRQMANSVSRIARDRSGALLINYGDGTQWFRSTDDGMSWSELPRALGNRWRERMAAFLTFNDIGSTLALSYTGELMDSADGGRTWTRRAEADQLPGYSGGGLRWSSRSSISGEESNVQMRAGADGTVWVVHGGRLYRSDDRGRRFEAVATPLPGELEPRRIVWVSGQKLMLDVWRSCRVEGAAYPGFTSSTRKKAFGPTCSRLLARATAA
jgi:photosystem II stability/assembly factor-like uncharacterized protein